MLNHVLRAWESLELIITSRSFAQPDQQWSGFFLLPTSGRSIQIGSSN